jgi:hypothetical protein
MARNWILVGCALALAAWGLDARRVAAEEQGALPGERITQQAITSGQVTLDEMRHMGMVIFSTAFNRHDGYGSGPGGRPTLGGNGTFLRVNGMDAQSCFECHSIVRTSTMPPTLGLGGCGGSVTNAMAGPTAIDVADVDGDGVAGFDGRFINPPFIFGVGGVELLALEMTADLQALADQARQQPGTPVALVSKGIRFGTLTAAADGSLDTSAVEGVADDLVVRPFGRKGEFSSVRAFDVGAMEFHFGMQPSEAVGAGVDADGDGVADEIRPGDLSCLEAFAVTLERPYREKPDAAARRGFERFQSVGCATCHVPSLETRRRTLPLRFPETETRPFENAYAQVDLSAPPVSFQRTHDGGLLVPLFSDLKRHDMGPGLAEHLHGADAATNRRFVTPRLWGVADSAPYLHDGRATTLTDAILAHGGDAQAARDAFAALAPSARDDLLAFLHGLRTPDAPARRLVASHAGAARHAGHGAEARGAHAGAKEVAQGPAAHGWWARAFRRAFGIR